jgi:hypothetical protein
MRLWGKLVGRLVAWCRNKHVRCLRWGQKRSFSARISCDQGTWMHDDVCYLEEPKTPAGHAARRMSAAGEAIVPTDSESGNVWMFLLFLPPLLGRLVLVDTYLNAHNVVMIKSTVLLYKYLHTHTIHLIKPPMPPTFQSKNNHMNPTTPYSKPNSIL